MKTTFHLTILTLILIFSCTRHKQDYFENKICNCFQRSYDSVDIDFTREMYNFQEYLVNQKLLLDTTGLSYMNVFKKIHEEDRLNFNNNFQLNVFEENKLIFNWCLNAQRSEAPENTKIHKLYLLIDSLKELVNEGTYTASHFCNKLFNVLNANDFDKPVYKYFALSAIYILAVPKYKDKYKITISTDSTNSIYLDSSAILLNDLDNFLKNKMANLTTIEKDKVFVVLEISPNTRMYVITELKHLLRKNNVMRINYMTKE